MGYFKFVTVVVVAVIFLIFFHFYFFLFLFSEITSVIHVAFNVVYKHFVVQKYFFLFYYTILASKIKLLTYLMLMEKLLSWLLLSGLVFLLIRRHSAT